RHADRPDRADLERVQEEVVVQQLPEVVEPGEARRDAESGTRVGEAEVDPARERRDAEEQHRQHRGYQQEERLALAQADAGAAAPFAGATEADEAARLGDGRHAATPQEARTTRRG